MNAYEHSIALGLTGEPAEKAAVLKATGLMARPIQLDDLMGYLNIPLGMLRRLPRADSDGSKWSGSLFNLLVWVNDNGTTEQKDGLNSFFSHITNDRNKTFDTTQVEFASQFWAVAQGFGGVTVPDGNGGVIAFPSVADFAAVAALGGGWLYAELTVEQFEQQESDAIEQEQTKSELESLTADETRHEILLSVNQGTDGVMRVVARVTPVEFADGVLLRRGDATVLANDVGLIAALTPIVEGIIQ